MNKWKDLGFRKPQNRIEWTLWIGTGFILLAIIISLLFVKKPLAYSLQTFTPLYITNILRDLGFGIIASALLIGSLIRLKKNEKKIRVYMGVIVGIFWFLFLIGRPAITMTIFSNMQAETLRNGNQLIEKLSNKLNKPDYSQVEKARFRKSIAQERYFQDGSLVEFINEDGIMTKYVPTSDDIQNRDMSLAAQRMITILRAEMLFWIIVSIAVFTGSIIYFKKAQD